MKKDDACCPHCGGHLEVVAKWRRKYNKLNANYASLENVSQIMYDVLKKFLAIPALRNKFEEDLEDEDMKILLKGFDEGL